MWEAIATTRKQDRVLHGVAKLVNVLVALVIGPLWFLGEALAGPLRRRLERPGSPSEPLPVPPVARRDLDALVDELEAIPHRLHPTRTATLRKAIADLSMFLLAQKRQTLNFGYAYPSQFSHNVIEGADGERIAAAVALHPDPRPGLVVVHGLFSSRLFDYVREIAVRAYYEWGFNVAAVDLRSFGITDLTSAAPSTAGWKEGEDLVCVARHLKSLGSTSVGALGISLGSSSVLNASYAKGADKALDGGVLAICGPADVRVAVERLDRTLPPSHPFFLLNRAFKALLLSKARGQQYPPETTSFGAMIELVIAPYYGVTPDEIYERASARNHIHRTRVPLLVLHSEDDEIIPVKHARMLEDAAAGNDNVRVWIVPGGMHAAFDVLDRAWTYRVYRTFFERLAVYAEHAAPARRAA